MKILKSFGKNISISKRIYIGFSFCIIAIFFTATVGVISLNIVKDDFKKFKTLNDEVTVILQLDRMVADIQRRVVSYIYSEQDSIKAQVSQTVQEILDLINKSEMLITDEVDRDLSKRMRYHLEKYQKNFLMAVKEVERKNILFDSDFKILIQNLKKRYTTNAKISLEIAIVERNLYQYLNDPNSKLVEQTLKLLDKSLMKNKQALRKVFLEIVQLARSYLYLVNVVMAAEAYEFKYISSELNKSITAKVNPVIDNIENREKQIQSFLTFSSLFFLVLGIIISWSIASGIVNPLAQITKAFQMLNKSNLNIEIPIHNRNDEIGVLAESANTFKDKSTELIKTVNELDLNKRMLEDTNEELSQFAYRTSHDLRAPLVTIISLVEIIQEDIKDESYAEISQNLYKISSSATTLESLVKDILSLTKADSDLGKKETCNVNEMVDVITKNLAGMIAESPIKIEYIGDLDFVVHSEKIRLQQVLENLISNSIKYADNKKNVSYTKIDTKIENNKNIITVADNGLGISKEYIPELFGMFKRFHPRASFGSGLGLYLVKKHLKKLNATIKVDSNEGLGTKFTIEI